MKLPAATRRWSWNVTAFLIAVAVTPGTVQACSDFSAAPHSRWGLQQTSTGWWLVTPCGHTFRSLGVNTVNAGARWPPGGYHAPRFYLSRSAWATATRARLLEWGFNTAGGWSASPTLLRLPVTPVLDLARSTGFVWGDPFTPQAAAAMTARARAAVVQYRGSPYRIGYFSDNEIGWWNGSLFHVFAGYPSTNRTKQRLVALLRDHYTADWSAFERDFVAPAGVGSFSDLVRSREPPRLRPGGEGIVAIREWTRVFAERYYQVARDAIRSADPDALFLGDRLPIYYDPDAVRAMVPYVDVVSVNYNVDAGDGWVGRYFFDGLRELTKGKPVLISEWFFAAHENRSGNRNRTGPPRRAGTTISHNQNRTGHLATVGRQADRAAGAAAAARRLLGLSEVVGLHWFQYYDHPPGGRDDGEDYNFGLVDIHDRPYEELIMALAGEHRAAIARSPSPRAGSRGAAVLPRAAIDVVDDSLLEWPKSASLLPMYAVRGEAVFGDVHAAWNETGLFLAVNAMDSYTPELLALRDDFPLDEAFQLLVGTDAGAGPRVHLFHVVPEEAGRNILGEQQLTFRVVGCTAAPAIGTAPECQEPTAAGVKARFFGVAMDQPRVLAELFLPWTALGVDAAPTVRHVRLEVGVGAFFRSRSMSMREGGVGAFEDPRQWSVVPLAD